MTSPARPTHYTLTRIAHPTHNPELLETYIDAKDGEQFTGGYLKHGVGETQLVTAYVAGVVMTDPGLRQHYTCDPPWISEQVTTETETHGSALEADEAATS